MFRLGDVLLWSVGDPNAVIMLGGGADPAVDIVS